MRRAKKSVLGSRRMWVNSLRATGRRPKKGLRGWLGFSVVGGLVGDVMAWSSLHPSSSSDLGS